MKKRNHLTYVAFAVTLVTFFSNCKKENRSSVLPIENVDGFVQKGPFISGSSITIYDLESDLSPTGKSYNTQTTDNSGSFKFDKITLTSKYATFKADGFYFNENAGFLSGPITLYTLADVSDNLNVNINLLTYLEKDRVIYLIKNGMSFLEAKHQAQKELLAIFSIEKNDIKLSENLNIAQEGDDNAILLAISAILQSYISDSMLSELLSKINNDIKEDGILDDNKLYADLLNRSLYSDTSKIKDNLTRRYSDIGSPLIIPDFGKYVDHFISEASLKLTGSNIFYPRELDGNSYNNILVPNDDSIYSFYGYQADYKALAYIPTGKSLIVKITELGTDPNTQSSGFIGYFDHSVFFPPDTISNSYSATIIPCFAQNGEVSGIRIRQPGSYLIEYFEDGSLTPTFTKKIKFI